MAFNAEQATKRYLESTQSGAARQKYIDGIQGVTESPMERAAQAEDLFLKRVEESVRSGRRAAKLRSTPMERWKANAIKKGAERLGSGAAAAADKMRAHMQRFGPVYDSIHEGVKSMPKGTEADALARVAFSMRKLKEAAGKAG